MIAFFAEVIQFFSFFHHLIKRVLDPDSLDPQHFCFQDPDPDPTGKISTKNCEKNVLLQSVPYHIRLSTIFNAKIRT